ncbi:acyltransferase-domain-containing protein [Teratosphaeria nubilosa]|uniref:1-acyl-sn-glycerol-3-phosphate acyltransferase n=1 Tax=Teratosphaeria nubilosa TaxID=161662 RepID=A0A6G1L5T9_9PEZI|nr:acyltransferase-domain-containing protein [Teratosphaeria nubilosa]
MNTLLLTLLALAALVFAVVQTLLLLGTALNNHTLTYYGRATASFAALFLCATYGTLASAVLNVAGYGGLGQWTTARSFKYTMLLFTGVWFEIEDPEDCLGRTRPAVFVGNHQTELDVLFLGHMFPKYCSVTAKKSLKFVPFLGWFMALSKTVFIERSSRDQAVAAFAKAAEQMHSAKQSVYIFPEGTRSYSDHPDLLPFKKGAFHLAVQAQVPIVPVVVANYSNILNMKRKIFRAGTIPVKVLEPISTKGKGKEDVDALLEEVREKMLAELRLLTTHAREEGVALKEEDAETNGSVSVKASGVDEKYNAAAKVT